jgi:hypothetical protein
VGAFRGLPAQRKPPYVTARSPPLGAAVREGWQAPRNTCHHNLETYLHAYVDGCQLESDPKRPLFRTIGRGTDALTTTLLPQANACAMIRRRAAAADIATKIRNHTFRASGITAYLKNGGTLESAANMANHASTRTTQLYDRRRDDVSLDEVERILIRLSHLTFERPASLCFHWTAGPCEILDFPCLSKPSFSREADVCFATARSRLLRNFRGYEYVVYVLSWRLM